MSIIKILTSPYKLILYFLKIIRMLTIISTFLIISALLIISFLIGFLYFVSSVNSPINNDIIVNSDAITVLTGGSNRLQSAISLLEKGYAKHLLISGVNPKTTATDLKRLNPAYSELFICCIELGHSASNTKENAFEIAIWVNKNSFKSLIVVTSNYHMPRALLEIKKITPNIEITPYPVISNKVKTNNWWSDLNTLKILLDEYIKILLIYLFR